MSAITAPTFDFASALPFFRQSSSNTRLAEKNNDPYLGVKKTADVTYLVLQGLKQKLLALQSLPENWDGHGSTQPNPLAVANALGWLEEIYVQIISAKLEWRTPHITASENGEVVFEWWRGNHELTLYFGADHQAEFIKVWGTHIKNEMADGQLIEPVGILTLWKWLGA
ncbi:MAG: hypothetical protein EPO47_05930 [Rugosibacter sp.]|nr:MAG: hypothetical protein EPO47_05930 [Rugosibacter sp.]